VFIPLPTNLKGNTLIESLVISKKTDLNSLLEFIREEFDYDFYYTFENSRIYSSTLTELKTFLHACRNIYVFCDRGDYKGIIMLWKSMGGGKERCYVKIRAQNDDIARNLLTVLLWNIKDEIFAKIRKDNKYLQVFKNKGFRFIGGRGIQVLLMYKPKKETNGRDTSINTRNPD